MEWRGSRRLLAALTILIATLLAAPGAFAADSADFDVIGYSPDGQYFAFEEFGIQDGSGFAFSTIYVLDLTADAWVSGTPVRVMAKDEKKPLDAVRNEAAADAKARLDDLGVTVPAHVVAMAGDGDPDRDGLSLRFGVPTPMLTDKIAKQHTLSIETYKAPANAPCTDWFGDDPIGFSLKLSDGNVTREVHHDDTLPRSRGCPVRYRATAVVLPFQATGLLGAVALISVYSHGFEGFDRRFVAVPLGGS